MRRTQHEKNILNGNASPACRHIQQQIPLFLDGELAAQDARNVASHLADCPLCQREREQWRQAEQALSGARQRIPAAGDLRSGFYARLAEAPASRRVFPRIDWRVAVPTLAACGLAFGWLTAQRPVVPAVTNRIAAAPAVAPKQEIAQTDNSHVNQSASGKPATNTVLLFGIPHSKADRHVAASASASMARITPQKTGQRSGRTAHPQIALAGSGRNTAQGLRAEHPGRIKMRRLAELSFGERSNNFAVKPTVPVTRFVQEALGYTQNRKPDTSLFADSQGESLTVLPRQRSKSTQQNTDVLAKATAKITGSDKDTNIYGYKPSAAKAAKAEKLKEQMAFASQPTQEAAFDNSRQETFALGVNGEMRRRSLGVNRGLGREAAFGEEEGIVLEVEDSKRGFTSGTRLASQMQEQNGKRVLTIRAEDTEPLTEDATPVAPVLEPK